MSQPATAVKTATRPAARSAPRPAARPSTRHPARLAGKAPAPARLRVVSARRHTRTRAGLVVTSVALLLVGLVGLLLLNVSLERGAYDLQDQSNRAEQLREQAQALQQEIQARQAPEDLAARARRLGMVDAPPAPVFVLPDGRTVGVPTKATAPPSPTVSVIKPKVTTTAKAKAAAAKATSATAKAATPKPTTH